MEPIDRRSFGAGPALAAADSAPPPVPGGAAPRPATQGAIPAARTTAATDGADALPRTIAMLVYPEFTALDLVGPQAALEHLPGRRTLFVWKNRETLLSDSGIPITPTATFAEVPEELEVLFVPGGARGTVAAMRDPEVLAFLANRGERAGWVTSVCTGSLVLGAAGLLRGRRATSHWVVRDLLPLLGAEPVAERVVEDGNRITGGGVTAGIDFGLRLVARLQGETAARSRELVLEYDPAPPFGTGTPEKAGPELTGATAGLLAPFVAQARAAAARAGARFPPAGASVTGLHG